MTVEKGTFQAVKPPNIYGNNRYLEEGTNKIISYDANIGKNKTIPLPGIVNEKTEVNRVYNHFYYMPEIPADINYRLIENTLGFQYYKIVKEDDSYYTGFGAGIPVIILLVVKM